MKNIGNLIHKIVSKGSDLNDMILDMLSLNTIKIFMVSKPRDWIVTMDKYNNKHIINEYGGYLLNKENKNNFISKNWVLFEISSKILRLFTRVLRVLLFRLT